MITVKHWLRSGFACEHTANSTEGALTESLRCRGLSTAGVNMMAPMLNRTGRAEYVEKGETFIFRTVKR